MMKFLVAAFALALVPGLSAQTINVTGGQAVATASNHQVAKQSGGNITTKKPTKPKPPTKPGKPAPSHSKSSSRNNSTNSNQLQNQSSNANANSNTNVAAAQGGAGGAGGKGVSTSTATGGAGGQSTANSSTNGTNSVDTSDHSVSNTNVHVQYIPPVVPETPASNLAASNVVVETGACGPLQRIVRTPVNGTFFGLIKRAKVSQGFTEDLEPYIDEHGEILEYRKVPYDGGYILYGDQVTQYAAVLGVSGAKNIALGGGAGSGGWGQGGLGASSANQQLVVKIVLRECEAGRIETSQASSVTWTGAPRGWSETQTTPYIEQIPHNDYTTTKKVRQ